MRKPNLNTIIENNLDKTKFQSKAQPSLPEDGWLSAYKNGGTYISDRAQATQFGQYKRGGGMFPPYDSWAPPRMQKGGIPQDPRSQNFYSTLEAAVNNSTDPRDQVLYQGFKRFNEAHGYAPANLNKRNIVGKRPMTNPLTGSLNILKSDDPFYMMDQYMAEYPHYQQYNEHPEQSRFKKATGALGNVMRDYGSMFKNLDKKKTLNDLGNLRFRKVGEDFSNAYEKNYDTPGTSEYEAHEILEPQNWDEFETYVKKPLGYFNWLTGNKKGENKIFKYGGPGPGYFQNYMNQMLQDYKNWYSVPRGKDDGFDSYYHHLRDQAPMETTTGPAWKITNPKYPDNNGNYIIGKTLDNITQSKVDRGRLNAEFIPEYTSTHRDDFMDEYDSALTRYLMSKKANGGDISIPNLQEGNWLNRYDVGGFTVTDETTKPKNKCKNGYGCHGDSKDPKGEGREKVGSGMSANDEGVGGVENYVRLSNAPLTWEELLMYNAPIIEEGMKPKKAEKLINDYKANAANRAASLQGMFHGVTQDQILAAGADSGRIQQRMTNLPRYNQPSEQTFDKAYHMFYRPLMNQQTPVTIPQILQFHSQQPGGLPGFESTVRGNYGRPKAQNGQQIGNPDKPYSKNNSQGYVSMKNNQDWFNSHANWTNTGNPEWDAKVRQQVMTGRFGVDPNSGALIKLPQSEWTNVSDENKRLATDKRQWTPAQKQQSWERQVKPYIQQGTKDLITNPVMMAPGAILTGGMAAGISAIAETAAAIAPALETSIAGVPGLTAGNLLNSYFAYEGAKNIPNVYNAWRQVGSKPTWSNIGNAAGETVVSGINMLPFGMSAYKGIPSVMQDVNQAGKYLTTQTPLKNSYKLNPWALKENPEMFLYRAEPTDFNSQSTIDFMKQEIAAGREKPWYKGTIKSYEEGHPKLIAQNDFHGQWFEKNPSRLDFYLKSGDKYDVGTPMSIIRKKLPTSEANKFSVVNNPKANVISASPETEFVLSRDMINSAERFPESSWQQLIQEDKAFNTPNWLRGYKEVPKPTPLSSSVNEVGVNPSNNFELFDLNKVRKPSGSIGNQGATPEGARDILKSIGIEVKGANSSQPTFKEMVEHLKNNPKDAAKYQKFLEKEPINISELPDGSFQINDGHHRATLAYYSGNESIPTIIKNKGEYIKVPTPTSFGLIPKETAENFKNSLNKFYENNIKIPIKYRKQISELKNLHKNALESFNNPEALKRLQALGIDFNEMKATFPDIKFIPGEGTNFNISKTDNGKDFLNFDFKELDEMKKNYPGFQNVYDNLNSSYAHELGHWLQHQSPSKELLKLEEIFNKTGVRPSRADLLKALGNPIDKQLISSIELNDPLELDRFARSYAKYFKNEGNEAFPMLREMREKLVNQGIIKNKYDHITPKHIEEFFKKGSDIDRIPTFTKPTISNFVSLSKAMNASPALIPLVAGAAALQQKKDGGAIISTEGYKQGPPPPGSHYRIPSNTLYNPTPYRIKATPNVGPSQWLEPYDTSITQFPGASYVDEYPLPMAQNGLISFLPQQDPEMTYRDRFNTPLNKRQTKRFNEWAAEESERQGRNIMMDKGAYDVQGFWKSGDYKRMVKGHGTDTWKKPNHPTFSNQSKYHGIDGFYGGNWTPQSGYQPSKQTADMYGPSYYNWLFGREPEISEYLDASRYMSGTNKPSPLYYKNGGWLDNYIPKAQNGLSFEQITGIKPITSMTNASDVTGGRSIQEKQKQDVIAQEIQRRNVATGKRQFVGQGQASTPQSEARRIQLNKLNTANDPNVQMDQFGNTSRINPNMTYSGQPANFMGERQQKGYEHVMGALEAAGYATGAGELAGAGYKALKTGLGESMESGLLSKLRPKYYKSAADRTWPQRFGETYSNIMDEYTALGRMHEISPENVVKPYSLKWDKQGNALGYKMQKFRGQNLNDYINSGKQVSPEINQSIRETVSKLHNAGLAHGDLFGNIMINKKGTKFKLIDPVGYEQQKLFPNFEQASQEDLNILDELLGKQVSKKNGGWLEQYQDGNQVTYTVKKGDTLGQIGKQFGMTPQQIADANNISNIDFIRTNQKLNIPGATIPQQPAVGPTGVPIAPVQFQNTLPSFVQTQPTLQGNYTASPDTSINIKNNPEIYSELDPEISSIISNYTTPSTLDSAEDTKKRETARKIVEIARQHIAMGKKGYFEVPPDVAAASYREGKEPAGCVGGACKIAQEAGAMPKIFWSNTAFTKAAPELGFPNKGYGLRGIQNLEPGDFLTHQTELGGYDEKGNPKYIPRHTQIFLGINPQTKEYEFFDNHHKRLMSYSEDDIRDKLKQTKNSYDYGSVIYKNNPFHPTANSYTDETVQQAADKELFVKEQMKNPSKYKYSIRPDAKDYNDSTKGIMNTFVNYANDDKNITDLVSKLKVGKDEIHDSLLNVFGELGQENNWSNSGKGLKSKAENVAEKVLTFFGGAKKYSVGPGQNKFSTIPEDLREQFGIKSPKDLYDINKVIPLMVAEDIRNKQVLRRWGQQNVLSHKLIGHTDKENPLRADDLKGGVGRWSPYLRNEFGLISTGKRIINNNDLIPWNGEDVTWDNFYKPGAGKLVSNYDMNTGMFMNPRTLAEGSYPDKVFHKTDDNLQRILITPNTETSPDTLSTQYVFSKAKKKKEFGGQNNWLNNYR